MRQIDEIKLELGEIADDLRNARARLIRLVTELERGTPKDEAWDRMVEGKVSPNVPYYLQGLLEILEEEDLDKVEKTLREAAGLSDATLAKIWSEKGETTET